MQGIARELNQAKASGQAAAAAQAASTLKYLGGVMGVLQQEPESYLKRGARPGALADAQIEEFIAARHAARKLKNFAESDRIRDQLSQAGILLEDRPGGKTEWRRA
jgi:cysteinyl-tRNA synthetase